MIKHRSGWPAWRSIAVLLALLHCGGSLATPKVYYVHTDHLGTPQVLSDKNQTVVWRAHYEPFGTATVDEDPDGDGTRVVMPIRFPGQYFDSESGLHYNYFRDYDPGTGRYIQSDPIGLLGGLNTYAYVGGNPLMYVDPYGLNPALLLLLTPQNIAAAGIGLGAIYCAITNCTQNIDWSNPNQYNEDTSDDGGQCPADDDSNRRGNPFEGEPGTWVEHPHDKQDRLYGNDGTPAVDIDYGHDHGQGSPHSHNWDGGVRGPGVPVSVIK